MEIKHVLIDDVVKQLDKLRDAIHYNTIELDAYDLVKTLDLLTIDLINNGNDLADQLDDANDESRDAHMWQGTYLDALNHAERHIEWLENEFADDIDSSDKYTRDI